jgi:heavy metal translocating P-type ATPase
MSDAPGAAAAAWWRRWRDWWPLAALTLAVLLGGAFWFAGQRRIANGYWAATTLLTLVVTIRWFVQSLRQRRIGVDVIATLALVSSLVAGEYLAGAVVALMLGTGHTLETYAQRRATRDLRTLLARAPRSARRRTPDGTIEVVDVDQVHKDDRLLVGPGEVVPVDGFAEDAATLDESVVTGESQPVEHRAGDRLASGATNTGAAFGLRAGGTAAESTYAGIVRMAAEANAGKAPMVRLADRYAAAFVPFTLALAGLAWGVSGHFVRAVAVLVVATPCPLLLAMPIAIVSGMSRTARRGVLVRDGGSLELLGRARTLLVDKTGTLTAGRPEAAGVATAPGGDREELLRLAASVEQLSAHVLAAAIVRAAGERGLQLVVPREVTEQPGQGVTGRVDGRLVRVGQHAGDLPDWAQRERQRADLDGLSTVWVSLDDALAGVVFLRDPVRPDARSTVRRLRRAGFARLIMVTGDRHEVAEQVARMVGADDVVARCSPEEKVARVHEESDRAVTVMVGDGVNDAPALATAGVGVALGATGATAAADVADAVLSVDRLDRLADAVEIARHSRTIAVQSAGVGMGLAVLAMVAAAFGLIPPVAGAFLQEGIDVAVILNALRALGGGLRVRPLPPATQQMVDRAAAEHGGLRDVLTELTDTADTIVQRADEAGDVDRLRSIHRRLTEEVLPHEEHEEKRVYPALATSGSREATAVLGRVHAEISRLVERIGAHLGQVSDGRLRGDQVPDLLATLYGLYAVLRLHISQEEEELFAPATAGGQPGPGDSRHG